jgi:hypothetical protein
MANTLLTQNGGQYGRVKGTAAGQVATFDGTDWTAAAGGGGTSGAFAYDIANGYAGTPATNAVLQYFVASHAFNISMVTTEHLFRCALPAAAASVNMRVARNGVTVLTILFSTGSTTGAVTGVDPAQVGVAVGDVITVEMVGAVDPDFSRPYWNVYAYTLSAFTYDVHGAFKGLPSANSVLDYFIAVRNFTLSTTVADLLFGCLSRPTSTNTTVYVKKNGATALTATFTSTDTLTNGLYRSSNVVVVSAPNCTFGVGDVLTVETDGTVDTDLATIIWALKGTP